MSDILLYTHFKPFKNKMKKINQIGPPTKLIFFYCLFMNNSGYISCGVHRFFDDGHDLHADASILTFLSGMFFHSKVKCK